MTVQASDFNTAYEALLDRTATLVPYMQRYTADGTWTKPPLCLFVEMLLVARGGEGGDGHFDVGVSSGAGGGGGGASGQIIHRIFDAADVPASLAITVSNSAGEESSAIDGSFNVSTGQGSSADGANATFEDGAAGGGAVPAPAPGTGATSGTGKAGGVGASLRSIDAALAFGGGGGSGQNGGAGTSGGKGGAGYNAAGGAGGAGGVADGAVGKGGAPGLGYGAGGGGGGGGTIGAVAGGSGGGGGGGASGYGTDALATAGADGTNAGGGAGGAPAPGIVIITAWCGVEVVP